jgi:hypothetical protein
MFWRIEAENAVGAFRVIVVMRLDGPIDPHVLTLALARLQARHPKLRAIIIRRHDGRHHYQFDRPAPPIPLDVVDYDDGNSPWREEARRLVQVRFPAEGPLAAVAVLRRQHRPYSEVILVAHHAIADGQSGIILMHDLLTEYASLEADRGAPMRPQLRPVSARRAPPAGWSKRAWLIRRFLRINREERRQRQPSLPEAENVTPQSQWVHWVFAPDETRALIRRSREERTSLGGALVAAVCSGVMDSLSLSDAVFKYQFPFDVRSALEFSDGRVTGEDVGSFASIMNAFLEVPRPATFWDLARRAHDQIQTFVDHAGPTFYYNLARAAEHPLLARAVTRLPSVRNTRVTLYATNYGIANLAKAYGKLTPRACTVMFPNDIFGASLVIVTLVVGAELNVGFAANRLEPVFWERLQVAVQRRLEAAALPE